jgi:transposase
MLQHGRHGSRLQNDHPTQVLLGTRRDQAAVAAALQLPWSNGMVEGQIHRLKLLKRQMYGRAGFDLLRLRVLNQA